MLKQLCVRPGEPLSLAGRDPSSTAGAPPGGQSAAEAQAATQIEVIGELQERLYAERRRSLLVVLEGVTCAGKSDVIRHIFTGMDPAAIRVVAFKAPTEQELAHDFLWRVHAHTPGAGQIAVFKRSHYEDVTTARVRRLAPQQVWRSRFEHINAFERLLGNRGTLVLKCFLHVSKEEQARRMRARAEDPAQRWKLTADDISDHQKYDEYTQAFGEMIDRTSTEETPWWVIPADQGWYRDWAVAEVLKQAIKDMDPKYPTLPKIPASKAL
ncbi:MAG: PPK2 family polyphosphate kinase [Acidimicrobiales bacterium]